MFQLERYTIKKVDIFIYKFFESLYSKFMKFLRRKSEDIGA